MSNVIEFLSKRDRIIVGGTGADESQVDRLQRDAREFGALAKDVRGLSGAVGECRQELQKIAADNPRLAKGADPADASLAKMDDVLIDIARRLDRLASAPIPLPLRPTKERA